MTTVFSGTWPTGASTWLTPASGPTQSTRLLGSVSNASPQRVPPPSVTVTCPLLPSFSMLEPAVPEKATWSRPSRVWLFSILSIGPATVAVVERAGVEVVGRVDRAGDVDAERVHVVEGRVARADGAARSHGEGVGEAGRERGDDRGGVGAAHGEEGCTGVDADPARVPRRCPGSGCACPARRCRQWRGRCRRPAGRGTSPASRRRSCSSRGRGTWLAGSPS